METKTVTVIGIVFLLLVISGSLVLSSFGIAKVGKFTEIARQDSVMSVFFDGLMSDQANTGTGHVDGQMYTSGARLRAHVTISDVDSLIYLVRRRGDESAPKCIGRRYRPTRMLDASTVIFEGIQAPFPAGKYYYDACSGTSQYLGHSTWIRTTAPMLSKISTADLYTKSTSSWKARSSATATSWE